jgi:hypothetical protein
LFYACPAQTKPPKKFFILGLSLGMLAKRIPMTRRNRTPVPSSKPLTVAFVALVVLLFAGMLLMLFPPSHRPFIPNICPIDAQLAEWSNRQGQRDCEYGHFSTVEKKPHTWVAACP